MGNKKKKKKVNPKKERYMKFKRDKTSNIDMSMPDLTEEQQKQKQNDEKKIGKFLRFNKNAPSLSVREKLGKKR